MYTLYVVYNSVVCEHNVYGIQMFKMTFRASANYSLIVILGNDQDDVII